jgi:hypothetical protein
MMTLHPNWYNALSTVVLAANNAMGETAEAYDGEELDERLCAIWEPVAQALLDNQPTDMKREWPELDHQAIAAGDDYVGVTSDTREVVIWGEERLTIVHGPVWRPFVILDRTKELNNV